MKEFYQMTQPEQLQAARIAYLVHLEDTEESTRYAVYLDIEGFEELQCLWPHEVDEGRLLGYQEYAPFESGFPAFHFNVDDMGMSRRAALATVLRRHNPKLRVLWLNGAIPSNC